MASSESLIIITIKAIIFEVLDLASDQCDHLYSYVTRCDQSDQITQINFDHQWQSIITMAIIIKVLGNAMPNVTTCDQV